MAALVSFILLLFNLWLKLTKKENHQVDYKFKKWRKCAFWTMFPKINKVRHVGKIKILSSHTNNTCDVGCDFCL